MKAIIKVERGRSPAPAVWAGGRLGMGWLGLGMCTQIADHNPGTTREATQLNETQSRGIHSPGGDGDRVRINKSRQRKLGESLRGSVYCSFF